MSNTKVPFRDVTRKLSSAPVHGIRQRAVFALAGTGKGGVRATCGAALALILLAGCAPDLGPKPEMTAPDHLASAQTFQGALKQSAAWPSDHWWTRYQDPQLNGLMDVALKDSPSLKIAAARVRSAMAVANIAGADLAPTVDASGSYSRTKLSKNQLGKDLQYAMPPGWHNSTSVGLSLNYELDFFGKNHAALAAATSAAEAAAADEAEARLQISTAVASTYAQLVQLFADKKLAEEAVNQRTESAALVQQRFDKRLENRAALAQAKSQVWGAKTSLDTVSRLIVLTQNQLAALLGQGPDYGRTIVPKTSAESLRPLGLPQNLPVNLIGRRPDIVAAKKRAEAAAKQIDVANANFYPNVDLTASAGMMSLDGAYLLKAASETAGIGPAVSLPIFDYHRLTGVYREARAGYDAAVASYDQTLTNALRDVADAYNNRQKVEDELAHAKAGLAEGEEAYRVVKIRYKAGLARYIEVLEVETQLIDQRREVADFETQAFAYDIALIRALGGGYTAPSRDKQ